MAAGSFNERPEFRVGDVPQIPSHQIVDSVNGRKSNMQGVRFGVFRKSSQAMKRAGKRRSVRREVQERQPIQVRLATGRCLWITSRCFPQYDRVKPVTKLASKAAFNDWLPMREFHGGPEHELHTRGRIYDCSRFTLPPTRCHVGLDCQRGGVHIRRRVYRSPRAASAFRTAEALNGSTLSHPTSAVLFENYLHVWLRSVISTCG
jgi:hypothetical protein